MGRGQSRGYDWKESRQLMRGAMNAKATGFLVVFALIITVLMSPIFWILVGVVAAGWGITAYVDYCYKKVLPNKYFASEEFLEQKAKISEYVEDCNALNEHIAELKALQDSIQSSKKGTAVLKDSSNYNFRRESWKDDVAGSHVYQCAKSDCSKARNGVLRPQARGLPPLVLLGGID